VTESLEREIRDLRALFWSERDPDGRGFAPLADAYRRAGDYRQALELVADGLGRLPTFATGHAVSARVHLEARLVEEAALAAHTALDLDPENVWALRTLADALTASGDERGAGEALERLHTLEPEADEPQAVEEAVEEEPDEPELEAALAPAPEPEAVEEAAEEEPELEAAVAPEPGEPEATVSRDVAAFAPKVPSVLDISALAPDEPSVLDISALAPDEPSVLDISALAPDEAPVLDISALAPDAAEDQGDWDPEDDVSDPPIYTRTMAELYVRQGLDDRAIEVYRHLLDAHPGDATLEARVAELEAAQAGEEYLEESEVHARHLAAAGKRDPKVETPFAWTEAEPPEAAGEAPPISRYFRQMLGWSPDEERP
jgi:tetratricopeptide (TPR) repeat protein